ncbi:3-methyladenine DNA glycosylase AlkD [Cytobacillus horneckiae]|uniref:DNA alkylation repair protein n=1 Tax=Cytobacillus horneckiae TaxID=549687 RepID=A0A2N0ZDM5_9BACI|nr:DNA alkylation repair protein [Cytobacillus horneckiae]MBN6884949.1 DNA alkylation repair protein [Cytobacillus horneckiae]MCM3179305.1 DNA alkylation repair protein [Cytobacillus horneckiae]MEC1154527.1 DNA alkylation repair protein [Cytobacillus horneckiae]MED2937862.1 DNA alkylation repair protein [Cytobacillus horneckiae]PKG27606.1 DNA alkylation repair protein [Cytobacillus horneckiae]
MKLLIDSFEAHRDVENAKLMEKYMKNNFPFLGIKTPKRRELIKRVFKETELLKEEFQPDLVRELWALPEREYHYAALDYVSGSMKKLDNGHMSLFEELITDKSWWDTIDTIAPHAVAAIASRFPEVIESKIDGWAEADHIWLRRSAILFQLKLKEKTDEERLYRYIVHNQDEKEFFIQKGIGWALREYSKTNPDSVRDFIQRSNLSRLSVREGSKYI